MKITIRDRNSDLINAIDQTWRVILKGSEGAPQKSLSFTLKCECADIFASEDFDALVSPANSFGFMNGGIDLVYVNKYGQQLENRVQDVIRNTHGGELLVGMADCVPLSYSSTNKWLIIAPTMRVPKLIVEPVDVYLATRAAIRTAIELNMEHVLFPGMGTGCGNVPAKTAAMNMIFGIQDAFYGPPVYKTCAQAVLDDSKFSPGFSF